MLKNLMVAFGLAGLVTASVEAALLFDFGTTPATGQTTVNATAAPNLGGPAGLTGSLVYNTISGTDNGQNATFPATYQYSDGTAATGVSVATFAGLNWGNMSTSTPHVRVGISGSRSGVGVFATPASPNNTNLFSDFTSAGNDGNSGVDYIGASVSGLSPGTYSVYIVSNNTYLNATGERTRTLRVGSAPAGLTDFSALSAPTTLTYDYANIATDTASWSAAEGKYWAKFDVTVTATNNTLYIGGFRSGDNQGGLFNAVQIVPEPASLALLGLGGVALVRRRR